MSNPNPCNAGKGRGKGNLNKNTAAIKDMIEGALQDAGGRDYLARQAEENPAAFMGLLGKILPKDVTIGGPGGGPVIVELIKRIVDTNSN
jgi:hypothetical protein